MDSGHFEFLSGKWCLLSLCSMQKALKQLCGGLQDQHSRRTVTSWWRLLKPHWDLPARNILSAPPPGHWTSRSREGPTHSLATFRWENKTSHTHSLHRNPERGVTVLTAPLLGVHRQLPCSCAWRCSYRNARCRWIFLNEILDHGNTLEASESEKFCSCGLLLTPAGKANFLWVA